MGFSTVAKILVLFFIGSILFSVFRSCYHVSAPRQQYSPAPVAQQAPPAQAPAQATTPSLLEVQPLIIEDKPTLKQGMTRLDIYNTGTDYTDSIPPEPVVTKLDWTEISSEGMTLNRISPNTVFGEHTLVRIRFLFHAGQAGVYSFGFRQNSEMLSSLRVNGVTVIALTGGGGYGQVRLGEGWYEVDFRQYRKDDFYRHGYSLSIKSPGDNEMRPFTISEVYSIQK